MYPTDFSPQASTSRLRPTIHYALDATTSAMGFDLECLHGLEDSLLFNPTRAFDDMCWLAAIEDEPTGDYLDMDDDEHGVEEDYLDMEDDETMYFDINDSDSTLLPLSPRSIAPFEDKYEPSVATFGHKTPSFATTFSVVECGYESDGSDDSVYSSDGTIPVFSSPASPLESVFGDAHSRAYMQSKRPFGGFFSDKVKVLPGPPHETGTQHDPVGFLSKGMRRIPLTLRVASPMPWSRSSYF
ncbi:hypothetical protein CYLTODRAFT_455945 [Cylindrobasidium torrendii FP15055 ss-10]|uniref:Uncharacterized protein n=1 Tax=Cylindrobasidium torrendii FP15055 ss-10 TaxID=1314674 RepID=A0A0D7B5S7_9AGAR|nr:hypothetical protein CYLTODRAFT_455945 [Cylindrobasidium torrendii FP15055 ss-10]